MKYCSCRNCDADFEFTGASKDDLGWHTTCPECGGSFDVDIEDYTLQQGTLVKLETGQIGTVVGFDDICASEYSEIIYNILLPIGKESDLARARRHRFEIVDNWRLTRRTDYGIDRVCHYPKNQEWGNVPCYGCVDRTKCNYDIISRLAQYEDTDLTPDDVAEYKKFEDVLVTSGLTFGAVLDLIERHKKGEI